MTSIEIWLVDNKTKRIRVLGHSGYNKSGYDIVCSSISTAMIMTMNLISQLCSKYDLKCDEKKVMMEIELLEDNQIGYIIMNNLYQTLLQLESQYPNNLKIHLN